MEQFVAYENIGGDRRTYPYLINMQHPIANELNHSLVIPVTGLINGVVVPKKVCPVVTIAGQNCVALTHMMAGIPCKEIGYPVQDLSSDGHKLRDAVDFLINGY